MNYVLNPNLPAGNVETCLIGENCIEEIAELETIGIKCIPLKSCNSLSCELQSHADMLTFYMGNGNVICYNDIAGEIGDAIVKHTVDLLPEYPHDVLLNGALIYNKLICNTKTISKYILDFAKENSIQLLHTNQGYTKCSVCVLNENAVITDDVGIGTLLKKYQMDVLIIDKGDIYLSDNHYGFIGGASGKVAPDKIYFSGNIESHRNYADIMKFLEFHNIQPVYNKNRPLKDFGGFIPFTEL